MSDIDPALAEAQGLLRAGRTGQAVAALRALVGRRPDLAAAQEALADALERSGDRAGAEAALRASLAAAPGNGGVARRLAEILTARHRAGEAIELLGPVARSTEDPALLTAYGAALKSEGRYDEAVGFYERAHQGLAIGQSAHNLAAALGDAHRFDECLGLTARAFELGLDAPETWLVQGRSLKGLGRLDEAEASLRQAIGRREAYAEAHAELAQLIWMRTESYDEASRDLDQALVSRPQEISLVLAKARLLEYAQGAPAAYAFIAELADERGHDAPLQMAAARLALSVDAELAHRHALNAWGVAPGNAEAEAVLCQANLAIGDAAGAARIAEDLRRAWPNDQQPVALLATAWRMLGDPRYRDLFDYGRLVRAQTIETPAPWPTLGAYLADLAAALRALQPMRGHPIGQSLRHGAQTSQSLVRSEDPAIKAFFVAIDAPIRAFIDILAAKDDALGRRATSAYRFTGAWSVLLRPGGHHVDHIHQLGWISSAFHVELPDAVDEGHQGWLKFGEPGLPTSPPLGAEHFVKPRAGDLVLFPSYMWHGTVPFGGRSPRLGIAFDVVPA